MKKKLYYLTDGDGIVKGRLMDPLEAANHNKTAFELTNGNWFWREGELAEREFDGRAFQGGGYGFKSDEGLRKLLAIGY